MWKTLCIVCITGILLIMFSTCYAQWAITYGSPLDDSFERIQPTSDGGYIAVGNNNFPGSGNSDIWVCKLNSWGEIIWQKTYGGNEDDFGTEIKEIFDNAGNPIGYILLGSTCSFGAGSLDIWVLKLNSEGSIIWQKTYGGSEIDEGFSILQDIEEGFIIAGRSFSFGADPYWILKINFDGDIVWQKNYSLHGIGEDFDYFLEHFREIIQTTDGGYVALADILVFNKVRLWIIKINSDGDILWQKAYGSGFDDTAGSIQQTQDGGFIVTGVISRYGHEFVEWIWILKLDSDGNILWRRSCKEKDVEETHYYPSSIRSVSDRGYIMTCSAQSLLEDTGPLKILVLMISLDGSIQWAKTYSLRGSSGITGESILYTEDGKYIVGGSISGFMLLNNNLLILKLNDYGEIPGCNDMLITNKDFGDPLPMVNPVLATDASVQDTPAVISDTSIFPVDSHFLSYVICQSDVDLSITMTDFPDPLELGFPHHPPYINLYGPFTPYQFGELELKLPHLMTPYYNLYNINFFQTSRENIIYTLTVTNYGPGDVTGVELINMLPENVIFLSSTPMQSDYIESERRVYFNLGYLDHGESTQIRIVVKPTEVGLITNRATVTAYEIDTDTFNNTVSEHTLIKQELPLAEDYPPVMWNLLISQHLPSLLYVRDPESLYDPLLEIPVIPYPVFKFTGTGQQIELKGIHVPDRSFHIIFQDQLNMIRRFNQFPYIKVQTGFRTDMSYHYFGLPAQLNLFSIFNQFFPFEVQTGSLMGVPYSYYLIQNNY